MCFCARRDCREKFSPTLGLFATRKIGASSVKFSNECRRLCLLSHQDLCLSKLNLKLKKRYNILWYNRASRSLLQRRKERWDNLTNIKRIFTKRKDFNFNYM